MQCRAAQAGRRYKCRTSNRHQIAVPDRAGGEQRPFERLDIADIRFGRAFAHRYAYSDTGDITYHDELLPGSCRPWVLLERRSVTIAGRSKKAFRFQVEPPADAPRGECRFMIAIEGVEPAQQTVIRSGGASLSLPVTGRIAVAVYVMLDGAEPRLEIRQIASGEAGGARRAVVTVVNTGDAHGRLDGSLDATDSQGRAFELVPEGTPILPGQTRTLALVPKGENGQPAPQPAYPVKASGRLDWDKGSFKVDVELK